MVTITFFWKKKKLILSNLIGFIERKKKFNLILQEAIKTVNKEEWIVVDKIVESKLNYCLIKNLENLFNYCGLQIEVEWDLKKTAIKIKKNSNKFINFYSKKSHH